MYIRLTALVVLTLLGCDSSLGGRRTDAGARVDGAIGPGLDAAGLDAAGLDASVDAAPGLIDAWSGVDAAAPPLGPPAARPPAPPPDHSAVIDALAAERADLLAGSCVSMGGSNEFLFEAVRRLRAIDLRYGLVVRGGAMAQDRVAYYWGDAAAEGSSEIYVLDIIGRHCAAPGDPGATSSWLDDSAAGGTWTILPLGGGELPDAGMPVDAATPPTVLPLPDGYGVVVDLAAEHPDWLAASCVADGGNNEFLFELVRRLRRMDPRWGLNWKRAVVGDMSQDAITYYWAAGAPYETAFDVHVVDVIGGHCGPSPSPAWIDVTVLGSTGAMWTLAGRTDLGP